MAVVVDIALCVAGKLAEYMVGPVLNQFKYLFCHTSIIQSLSDELENLANKRESVQSSVDVAYGNSETILPEVLDWLQKVDGLREEAGDILKNSKKQFRYRQSRKAIQKTSAAIKLHKKGVFKRVSHPTPPQQIPIEIPSDSEGLETRISKRKEIVEALINDEAISVVGICGMAGVGKTKMADEIEAELKNVFEVTTAVVPEDVDIKKIQNQIAEMLGKKFEEQDNEILRAGRLHERLTKGVHKKILVILDQVWDEVDFTRIGIPLKGLKILLTSRSKQVCAAMGAAAIYEVDVLRDSEAWKLFKDAAAISDDDSTSEAVKGLATDIAKECGGLPLALDTVDKALRNKEDYAWSDALLQLQNSKVIHIKGIHDKVYKRIESSYNYLGTQGAKSLFLLCSLFPKDHSIPIETLVRYARGLMLFTDTATLLDTKNRAYSIVHDLKSCYMLLSGEEEHQVKLHNVVRYFCLEIASKGEHVYMVKHAADWTKHDDDSSSSSYSAISLTFDGLNLNELPSGLEYPRLKLLRLVNNGSKKMNVPESFFSKMNKLKVVDFYGMRIQVSSSLQSLTSLQTLCLDYCNVGKETCAEIGQVKNLEILSLYRSYLFAASAFPIRLEQLSNLKSLDLRVERVPEHPIFQRGVFSGLNKLEELYLGNYFPKCMKDETEIKKEDIIITEISSLNKLNTFQIHTADPEFLMKILQTQPLKKLKRFQIILTHRRTPGDYHFGRSLDIDLWGVPLLSKPLICSLMNAMDNFRLTGDEKDLKINVFSGLRAEGGFVKLKKLQLGNSNFEYLVNAAAATAFSNLEHLTLWNLHSLVAIHEDLNDSPGSLVAIHEDLNDSPGAFARLEVLILESLPVMKYLWKGVIEPPSLCNLRILKISGCNCIKSLFQESIAKCLANLQSVRISWCPALEQIFSSDAKQNNNQVTVVEFQKLKRLELSSLKNFKSFRSESSESNTVSKGKNPKTLFNQVMLPNLELLDFQVPGSQDINV